MHPRAHDRRHHGHARDRIIAAAARLLAEGGREAVSTRAVSAAAGVQAPTICQLFGDKQGLLDAVAADGLCRYLSQKASRTGPGTIATSSPGWIFTPPGR